MMSGWSWNKRQKTCSWSVRAETNSTEQFHLISTFARVQDCQQLEQINVSTAVLNLICSIIWPTEHSFKCHCNWSSYWYPLRRGERFVINHSIMYISWNRCVTYCYEEFNNRFEGTFTSGIYSLSASLRNDSTTLTKATVLVATFTKHWSRRDIWKEIILWENQWGIIHKLLYVQKHLFT